MLEQEMRNKLIITELNEAAIKGSEKVIRRDTHDSRYEAAKNFLLS